ncbi:MAG: hypothetical protein ABS74_11450 [Pelagibacterium sp. SCN 63-126]|nr:MAG: hypothetical protein ABS74_11450 [Pelagibacterium sp. SCN 63-126]
MAVLDSKPRFQRYQRLVLRRNEVQAPLFVRHVRGINRAREQFVDSFLMDFTVLVFWPSRLRLKKTLHFHNRLKTP